MPKKRPGRICSSCGDRYWKLGPRKECSDKCHVIENTPVHGDCWEWKGSVTGSGYGRLSRKGKCMLAHRMVYELFVGPIPDGMVLRHACDNPLCVNPDHLEVGTHSENTQDQYDRGRNPSFKGERNSQAKLTADDVRAIRKRIGAGETQTSLAREYGLDPSTVSDIKRRKNWAHV